MKLFLYRVSLTERSKGSLFDALSAESGEEVPQRKNELERVFSKRFDYSPNSRVKMTHFPIQNEDGYFAGVLGRWMADTRPADEKNPFLEKDSNYWELSSYFFNANDDEQVLGIEFNRSISSDHSRIVEAFVEGINKSGLCKHYKFDIRSLNHDYDFWSAVTNYPKPITSLKFDFVAPNGPNNVEATREAMKMLHDDTNSPTIKQEFCNNEGVDLNSKEIKARQEYASGGGGETVAKSGKKIVYNSVAQTRSEEVDDTLKPTSFGQGLFGLSDYLKDVLRKIK